MRNSALTSGMGTTRWVRSTVERIPIPNIPEAEQRPFIRLVDVILQTKTCPVHRDGSTDPSADITKYEAQIDLLVYKHYDLTSEEIAFVQHKKAGYDDKNRKTDGC